MTSVSDSGAKKTLFNAAWHPDGERFYWAASEGVFCTHIPSRGTIPIRTNCGYRSYYSVEVSPSGDKLIVSRIDGRNKGEIQEQFQNLVMIDLNTDEETLLKLWKIPIVSNTKK